MSHDNSPNAGGTLRTESKQKNAPVEETGKAAEAGRGLLRGKGCRRKRKADTSGVARKGTASLPPGMAPSGNQAQTPPQVLVPETDASPVCATLRGFPVICRPVHS